jgi:anthranilate phosphoribosyltransferase
MAQPYQFEPPEEEHPFAPFIRILGKGKTGTRSLTEEEARSAFVMVLRGKAEPLQVGAFLMLLRVKEESPEELAGFVHACRGEMRAPPAGVTADLDWSSYAGKRHQHPWFLLSLLLLSGAGYRLFIHGSDGHTPGRLYTEQAMLRLGLPVADDWQTVTDQLAARGLSYLPLRHFCPALHELMQLRPKLGLRSPVNTLARLLNPLRAPCSMQSIFHPAYGALHQAADDLLGQPAALVFKGESGEIEVKPQADTRLQLLREGRRSVLTLPRTMAGRVAAVASPDVEPLRELWFGGESGPASYGLQAVLATTAAALLLLEEGISADSARLRAAELWQGRNPEGLA